jgi:tetratricopeptide (TPR) repeat protein
MFRKRLVAVCILASAVASVGLPSSSVQAQEVIDLDEGAKPNGGKEGVDVDLDEGEAPAAPGPVTAGKMSGAMGSAKALFDKEKWNEAAQALHRVVTGETGDDPGNKQIAEYYLAVSLYRLKFYQASYAIFSVVSDNPNHLKFKETLLWLAKLATQLPEPADIIERVGKYTDGQVARFDNAQQRDLYWQLNYLLGRYKYRNRRYEESIRLFQKVDRNSPYYVKGQFFTGISYVQLRKSAPAVRAFQRIVKALDEGVEGVEDEDRMRDLAYLSMARTYYSASITLDPETNAPSVNEQKLSAAVKYWNSVDVASEYWLDALFEESWAYFMAGQYPKALGNIHTIQAPYFPNSFYPEAEILKAVIYFTNCNYEAASTTMARFQKRYGPLRNELQKILKKYSGENQEEAFYEFLLDVREGKGDIDERIRPIVEIALSDRQLLRNIQYVTLLEDEQKRFKRSALGFRSSSIGMTVGDALQLARDLAVRQAGELALQRYRRNLEELNEFWRDGEKMFIDLTIAERNILDQKITTGQVSKAEAKIFGVVKPDEEHVLWPFDGEYWRDELGFYRQVVASACGR